MENPTPPEQIDFTAAFICALFSFFLCMIISPWIIKVSGFDSRTAAVATFIIAPILIGALPLGALIMTGTQKLKRKLKIKVPCQNTLVLYVMLSLLFFIAAGIVSSLFGWLLDFFSIPYAQPVLPEIFYNASTSGKWIIAFSAIVLAPAVEELLFRHIAFSFLQKYCGLNSAFILCTVAFTVLHDSYVQFPGLLLLGAFFQYAYIKYDSLLLPVLLHSCNNALAFAVMVFVGRGQGNF